MSDHTEEITQISVEQIGSKEVVYFHVVIDGEDEGESSMNKDDFIRKYGSSKLPKKSHRQAATKGWFG